ncbi:hypothetical protein SK224_16440 [Microbacterium sp. BG28]|uniref:hypothetical protein n=1 Tax=Microbacterium sp. BG28 TaxID=3097356 RepID=UPI002A59BDCE|nr:hypothetical protein [Microbacterium sp. BG28]MDY0830725.1 hypothetical protein [Microbacterium sp. BG28]
MMRALWRASIWHPDAIPPIEEKYASPLKRVLFPVYDLVVIWLAWAGLGAGFRALALTFPSPGPSVLYGALMAAGLVCFIGAAFPRLWVAEIVGKLAILALLGILMAAMYVAAAEIPGHTGANVAPMIAGMMLPPLLRLWILGVEWAGRSEGAAWTG